MQVLRRLTCYEVLPLLDSLCAISASFCFETNFIAQLTSILSFFFLESIVLSSFVVNFYFAQATSEIELLESSLSSSYLYTQSLQRDVSARIANSMGVTKSSSAPLSLAVENY